MNERQLSNRLIKVADYVPPGATVADIGSDHAYLPCYLCLQHAGTRAIAGEVNEGPFQSAKEQVARTGLSGRIDVRKGNGLEVIEPGEADVITIAGMGGSLITSILEEGKEKLEGVSRLVLQPNVAAEVIRAWLRANQWVLTAEEILEEDEKVYEILVAERGDDAGLYAGDVEKKLLLGPYLLKQKNEAFQKKWRHELTNWKRILDQQARATETEELRQRQKQLQNQINIVEEVLG
ncbi:tRNA (adenine(22)-N(1))-methyltransferase [Halalkalibacter oceani]|uniref:tRNA (Adenine(22)-N(1))-methyltransferase TrmK n=1 Tax=Halalkalibacter oceani TaxID=1653776 RepID=A0A9X2IMA6_9BACI|nr:tRNA (adenine(22)-N(1))-methyltransferase TrmK [Halalkalibacter oceani]MCM3712850.1 tRNA (adenine(22)-N(1))-methyltransferase TrmK [Halalkalibacter oceani]